MIPGWHTTIFPPYFVAGAIFSGFGMVLTLMLPLRAIYRLEDLITQYHIDCMCKIILATGTMVGYAYAMEFFIAWYSANPYEGFTFVNRAFGPFRLVLLDHDLVQRDHPAVLLVQVGPREHDAWSGSCRCSSTSACGSSAS